MEELSAKIYQRPTFQWSWSAIKTLPGFLAPFWIPAAMSKKYVEVGDLINRSNVLSGWKRQNL